MSDAEKTHYRKAFNSPYLNSADIVGPTILTIQRVALDPDKTKRTKDVFNTAYFVEKTIRQGEVLKPMILNAGNSKTMESLAGSAFIDDWQNIRVEIFVDHKVRFGRTTVQGLRISPRHKEKPTLTPANKKRWAAAKIAFVRDGHLNTVLGKVNIADEHQQQLHKEYELHRKQVVGKQQLEEGGADITLGQQMVAELEEQDEVA